MAEQVCKQCLGIGMVGCGIAEFCPSCNGSGFAESSPEPEVAQENDWSLAQPSTLRYVPSITTNGTILAEPQQASAEPRDIQRYDIKRYGGVDLDDALVPYEFGAVVKTEDHCAQLAALKQTHDECAKRSRADRLARYVVDQCDHLLNKSPSGDLVTFYEAAAAIRVLEGKCAALQQGLDECMKALEIVKRELNNAMNRIVALQNGAAMQCVNTALLNIDVVLANISCPTGKDEING